MDDKEECATPAELEEVIDKRYKEQAQRRDKANGSVSTRPPPAPA